MRDKPSGLLAKVCSCSKFQFKLKSSSAVVTVGFSSGLFSLSKSAFDKIFPKPSTLFGLLTMQAKAEALTQGHTVWLLLKSKKVMHDISSSPISRLVLKLLPQRQGTTKLNGKHIMWH
jgi:hypothetical protein